MDCTTGIAPAQATLLSREERWNSRFNCRSPAGPWCERRMARSFVWSRPCLSLCGSWLHPLELYYETDRFAPQGSARR